MATSNKAGIIFWFVTNPVAANLLMLFIIIIGLYSADHIQRELFPDVEHKGIAVRMTYPAASPKEVEEGITIRMEEAIKNVAGIKKIYSISSHSLASLNLEVYQNVDVDEVLDEIKNVLGAVSNFPRDAEGLTINKAQPSELALQIQLFGDFDEKQGKEIAEEIKRELLAGTDIKRVKILGTRPYEIAIEISEEQLQKYHLTLGQVAAKIRAVSVNLPSGGIRSSTGGIVLRVQGQSYNQQEFENIILLTSETGSIVRVGDIATVSDAFGDYEPVSFFDGKYSLGIAVSAVPGQDLIDVGNAAKKYLESKRDQLPDGVHVAGWLDITHYLNSRLNMMIKNMLFGAILVFILLALFMDLKIAFWVMAGLPVCFLGTFILMPMTIFSVSLNMVSLFGFILVLGIIVDDAIIVAESVDDQVKKYGFSKENVIIGTNKVAIPAMFGVLTTIVAFLPTLFVDGEKHAQLFSIGFVICFCLLFSLMESKWILPSHLAGGDHGLMRFMANRHQHRLQEYMNNKLKSWVLSTYQPFVTWAIHKRYITLSVFLGMLMITVGLVAGGIVKYVFYPPEPNDFLQVVLRMGDGTPNEEAKLARNQIEDALYELDAEYQKEFSTNSFIKHRFSYAPGAAGASFMIELTKAEDRELNSDEIIKRWSEKVGYIEGSSFLDFSADKFIGSKNLSFTLVGNNKTDLELASGELSRGLRLVDGLSNFNSSEESKTEEYIMHLKPKAIALGLTLSEIALQVKEAFYGAEAQRIQRDNEDIKVIVRYPSDRRASIIDLEEMYIRLQDGRSIPIKELVDIEYGFAQGSLTRINGEMSVFVNAIADPNIISPAEASAIVSNKLLPEIFKKYPTVSSRESTISQDQKDLEAQMKKYFLMAMLGVFILLAIPLKSYLQPLLIMSVIPFGIVGAVWGHLLLGFPISMMSLFGIIALSGVVVNDSLVMVDFVNRSRAEGYTHRDAVIAAGGQRFRAIMLTTVTTFAGVLPMILETSVQAQSMIPMAVSLGFGIVFATTITLILIPCLYMILEDIKRLFVKSESEELAVDT